MCTTPIKHLFLFLACLGSAVVARLPWKTKRQSLAPPGRGLLPSLWSTTSARSRRASLVNAGVSPLHAVRLPLTCPRGGANDDASSMATDATTNMADAAAEEERYSRQVYAVGKRAHGLIRSTTMYLDGPAASGLMYEVAKNLALSGIRKIVLIGHNDEDQATAEATAHLDACYHNQQLDDLGNAYLRAAKAELGKSNDNDAETGSSSRKILAEYIQRLNPFVQVSTVTDRTNISSSLPVVHGTEGGRHVLVSIDRPYATQVTLNQMTRTLGMSFVSVDTAGVFGRVFCDFGPSFQVHDADGETPLVTPLLRIENFVDSDDPRGTSGLLTIHCMEGEKHDVSKGDVVQFQFRNGEFSDHTCRVQKVKTPFQFVARLEGTHDADAALKHWNEAVSFSRVKNPQTLEFVTLEEAAARGTNDGTLFTACDLDKSWDDIRRRISFACFQALDIFVGEHGRLPTASDQKAFRAIVGEACNGEVGKPEKTHVQNFLWGCQAKLSPFQAIFGAIGAQEALKAATGLYSPVSQFLLYDCDEVLDTKAAREDDSCLSNHEADAGLRYILGDQVVDNMQSKQIFVVGAGAIGCELLKNLVAMGAGTKSEGKIVLTDMDTIEKSNLSRQFLFRDADIGKFKSLAAKESALRFQPSANIEAHSTKVGGSEDNLFGDEFWSKKVDTVLNALDNVDARVFIDGQCVANQKALVDAGTLGPKGNVQVVVPFQTESYSSSADPPEEAIPVCTLKNFPYAISHTIQWGRDLFDGYFRGRPSEASKFVSSLSKASVGEAVDQAVSTMGEEAVVSWAEDLATDLSSSTNPEDAVNEALKWSVTMTWKLYHQAIEDLLEEHPIDSRDEDGELFWSGSRRPPTPLKYFEIANTPDQETINSNLEDFVQYAARLRVECYKVSADRGTEITKSDARNALMSLDFKSLQRIHKKQDKENGSVSERVLSLVKPVASLGEYPEMVSAEFEKDDDSNGHVAFVTAASNLRAICYGIPPVDAMETRRIAGNIIPAMITTTAFVSAVSCIEMIKLVQEAPLKKFRNAFINLALPFFAFTVPLPAEPVPGLQGREYTIWNRLSIKESRKIAEGGGLTMKSLIKRLRKLASDEPSAVSVSSISLGPFLLYASFLHEDDKALLKSTVWETIAEALDDPDLGSREEDAEDPSKLYSHEDTSFDLTVVVEDLDTGEEAELPNVNLKRYTRT